MLVGAQVRLWYNPGRDSPKFYGPGIFVMGISMFPALLAALAMAKEGEQKTILQVYVSSISAHEFLLGKILAFMVVAAAEWLLAVTTLLTVFGLHIAGDPTPFLVGSVLYAFCVAQFRHVRGRRHSEPGGGDSNRGVGRLSAGVSALRTDLPGGEYSRPACAGSPTSFGAGTISKSCATPCCRAADGRPCGFPS